MQQRNMWRRRGPSGAAGSRRTVCAPALSAIVAVLACCHMAEAQMPSISTIATWANAFGTRLGNIAAQDLKTTGIQSSYEGLSWSTSSQNGTAIFETLQADFSAKMASRVAALKALRDKVEAGYAAGTGSTTHQLCCTLDTTSYEFNPLFFTKVDTNANCVKFPTASATDAAGLRATSDLITTMKSNRGGSASLRWQYFGSQEGMWRLYPADKSAQCHDYDPRFRPWYVLAATPIAKDVVVIVDSSGSMGINERMAAAKGAAQVVLDTLNPNDYVNVVDFDSQARVVQSPPCFASGMAQATPRNRKVLSDYISDAISLGGQTEYLRALTLAYQLLENSKSSGKTSGGNRTILFLTDGEPTDSNSNSILDFVRSKHAQNPDITLLTYAFGSGLDAASKQRLAEMASITGGVTDVIPDGGNLRSALGSYYDFFSFPDPDRTPVFTAPYWDASGLGLVVTAALPVYQGTTLKGVVGVDLTLSDLVSQVQFFDAGQNSFSFVVDSKGRVLMHPLLPAPDASSADAIMLDLSRLEPSAAFTTNVRNPMVAGRTGKYSLTLQRALSRGDSRTEGVKTVELPFTVWFGPIKNSHLRVAIALADADLTVQKIDTSFTSSTAQAAATYHRIDLVPSEPKCAHGGVMCTKRAATFKLAPTVFVDPSEYLDVPETASTVAAWNNWVAGTSSFPPIDVTDAVGLRRDIIATNAIASAWIASAVEADIMPYTVWRYIGTTSGVWRVFPGHSSSPQYNPAIRPWFSRAVIYKGSNAISTPYEDASGAGMVITMSRAIYEGPSPHNKDDPYTAVAAIDFSLGRFYAFMQDQTGCSPTLKDSSGRSITCFVMDESGYIVVHPKFTTKDIPAAEQSDYFIGEMYPRLAQALVDQNIVTQSRCNAFETLQTHLFYTSEARTVDALSGTVDGGCDARWALSTIPGTNTYLIAVTEASCLKSSVCSCDQATYPFPATSRCQCPGPANLDYNTCTGVFTLHGSELSDPTCPPPPHSRDVQVNNQKASISGLSQCYVVSCSDSSSFLDCYGRLGCDWCEFDENGEEMPVSQWHCSDTTCPEARGGPVSAAAYAAIAPVAVALAAVACVILSLRRRVL